MAELGFAINALIALGVRSKPSIKLHRFIENVRSAPNDMQVLGRELQEFGAVLGGLEKTLITQEQHSEKLSVDMGDVLDSCMEGVFQLEMLVGGRMVKEGDGKLSRQWKKWKWGFREKKVQGLKRQLEAHKAVLNTALLVQ